MNSIVRLHMLKVLPGYLPSLLAKLKDKSLAREGVRFKIFASLGDYDLIVFSLAPADQSRILGLAWFEGVAGIREIPVFAWGSDCRPEKLFFEVLRHDSLTLTFIYFHPNALRDCGVHIEYVSAQALRSAGFLVCGLYGIPEMLAISSWGKVHDIQANAAYVYNVFDTLQGGPHISRTMSFLAIVNDGRVGQESFSLEGDDSFPGEAAVARAEDSPQEPIEVKLLLTSSYRSYSQVDRVAASIFGFKEGTVRPTLGLFDFSFDFAVRTKFEMLDLIRRLDAFLLQLYPRVVAVSTVLSFPKMRLGMPIERKFERQDFPPPLIKLSVEDLLSIETQFGEVGRRIVRTIFNFNDIATNPVLTVAVLDISYSVARLAAEARAHAALMEERRLDPREAHARERELSELMLPIHSAVDQRTIAAHAALSPVESQTRYLLGGIGRLLLAIEAIPHSIFRKLPQAEKYFWWWGYALSGVRHRHFYHERQVIDVPPSALWTPEDWYVVVHEAMHALVSYESSRDRGTFSDLRRFIESSLKSNQERPNGLDEELVEETIVDVLTFNCGPFWNPGLYFRGVWSYLKKHLATRANNGGPSSHPAFSDFVYRTVVSWLAWKTYQQNRAADSLDDMEIAELVSLHFMNDIRSFGLDWLARSIESGKFLRQFKITDWQIGGSIAEYAKGKWLFDERELRQRQSAFECQVGEALRIAAKMEHDFSTKLDCPELIVWKLRQVVEEQGEGEMIELREATILLLINEFWSYFRDLSTVFKLFDAKHR